MPHVTYSYGDHCALAIVLRERRLPRLIGRDRRVADERSAVIARRLAIAAILSANLPPIMSVSHTEGSAAVLVRSGQQRIGVDLVLASRITQRHACAILSRADWSALASVPRDLRGAVGWALKEATAKATGNAQKYFPDRVRLLPAVNGRAPQTRCAGRAGMSFEGHWFVIGGFVCATAIQPWLRSARLAGAFDSMARRKKESPRVDGRLLHTVEAPWAIPQ